MPGQYPSPKSTSLTPHTGRGGEFVATRHRQRSTLRPQITKQTHFVGPTLQSRGITKQTHFSEPRGQLHFCTRRLALF